MIHESIAECIGWTPVVRLKRLFPQTNLDVIAKLEFLNPGGSVKDRSARFIIEQGLRLGTITAHTHLIESSSGNFGIALAMIARVYGLAFTCVVDPKISSANMHILHQLGARVEMVHEPDDQQGYLKTRIRRVQELLARIPQSQWINQYANELNWQAHYYGTATELCQQLEEPPDCLVVAVSTTGTLMGMARRLRENYPRLRIIAVDAVGSVIFGAPAGPREIPGIGSSHVPELLRREEVDEVIAINDREAVQGCQQLVGCEGILAGGSSGAVIAAIQKLIPGISAPFYRILTLLPDRGDRYLDMVYDENWVARLPRLEEAHKGV